MPLKVFSPSEGTAATWAVLSAGICHHIVEFMLQKSTNSRLLERRASLQSVFMRFVGSAIGVVSILRGNWGILVVLPRSQQAIDRGLKVRVITNWCYFACDLYCGCQDSDTGPPILDPRGGSSSSSSPPPLLQIVEKASSSNREPQV